MTDSFLSKLFLAILGPFIGVGGSLWLYYLKTRQDKGREEKFKIEENDDLLNYFSSLSNNLIYVFNIQAELIGEFANVKRTDPFRVENEIKLKVNRDVERIQELDQAKIIKAYNKRFGHNKNTLLKFTKIYSSLDYFYEIKNQLKELVKLDHEISIELSNKFASYASAVQMDCADLVGKGRNNKLPNTSEYNTMWREISRIMVQYFDQFENGVTTIPQAKELFIDPIRTYLIDNFSNLSETEIIIKGCKRAGDQYKTIEQFQIGSAVKFLSIKERIEETTGDLMDIIPGIKFSAQ